MSATQQEVRNRVLELLVILGAGQTATGADAKKVDDAIGQIHEELVGAGIASWDLTAIPDEVVRPLTRYVAADIGPALGKTQQQMLSIFGEAPRLAMDSSMLRMQRQTTAIRTDEPVEGEYF